MNLSLEAEPSPSQEGVGLAAIELQTEYRTGEADLIRDFFRPCLSSANGYDRAVGFFRSSVFTLTGEEVLEFARKGGTIRLVCSPSLTEEDFNALSSGYERRADIVASAVGREVDSLLGSVDLRFGAETLATFIVLGVVEIRIAIRPQGCGIYHEKIGIFSDEFGNYVSFRGSSNESWAGWHERGNLESFDVFCSWRAGTEAVRVARHKQYFDRLWESRIPQVEVLPFPDAARRKLCTIARPRLEDLARPSAVRDQYHPREHQLHALRQWEAQGRRGILEHATGSGKTLTGLLAVENHLSSGGVALIVVPTRILFDQWAAEIGRHLPDAVVLKAGAGNQKWRHAGRLEGFSRPDSGLRRRIILATLRTASQAEFRGRLRGGPHVFLLADEVHQTGSPQNSMLFRVDSGPRLGLSATPTRFGDPEGTKRILDYFGPVIQPPFTLGDAIRAGLLVPYEYFPHPVLLSDSENEAWANLTLDIKREIARRSQESDRLTLSERARILLIQRARIAKKACNKIPLAERVLKETFREGQRWLVYCEDTEQLDQVMQRLRAAGLEAGEYHSQMLGDPQGTLRWFRQFGGILVSIRCLDEGVDIPDVSHALILASSQNPRQFIQRRGRVLRIAPGKAMAVVHDVIVVPANLDDEPEQIALAKAELTRALQFADSALNRDGAAELRDVAARMCLDLRTLRSVGMEEDADDE
jgi:superfamily II DNA or RNA helicase